MAKTSKGGDVLVRFMSKARSSQADLRKKTNLEFNKVLTKSFDTVGFLGRYIHHPLASYRPTTVVGLASGSS